MIGLFGTPSPLTYAIVYMVRNIVQHVYGHHHFIQSSSFEQLRSKLPTDGSSESVVVFSDYSHQDICELFLDLEAPIIVAYDDPSDTMAYAIEARGVVAQDAVRIFTQIVAPLDVLSGCRNSMRVSPEFYQKSLEDGVSALLAHLRVPLCRNQVAEIYSRVYPEIDPEPNARVVDLVMRCVPSARPPGKYKPLEHNDRLLVDHIATEYRPILKESTLKSVTWPRTMFHDRPSTRLFAEEWQDMTGRARYLVWGPYLCLPRGLWTAQCEIEVKDNWSGNKLHVEARTGRRLRNAIVADLPAEGSFEFEIDFWVDEPSEAIEINFATMQGSIEGMFGVRLVRLLAKEPETAQPARLPIHDLRFQLSPE